MTTLERTTTGAAPTRRGFDWPLAIALLGSVMGMYAGVGYVLYATLF